MSTLSIPDTSQVGPEVELVDMKLEVVLLSVIDVERAKAFYTKVGFRLDIDVAAGGFRGVQMTPRNSETSIVFGNGVTSPDSAAVHSLVLVVDDLNAACDELIARGVEVSDVFHYAGGPFNNTVENARVAGRDPEGRSYFSFASFEDPDGNVWLLQEVKTRLPGRAWETSRPPTVDTAVLAELLRETVDQYDRYARSQGQHHRWDWYASYVSTRLSGGSSEAAAAVAEQYLEVTLHARAQRRHDS